MSINWDRVANIFADHERIMDKRNRRLSEWTPSVQVDQMVEEAIRSLPEMLENHLSSARASGMVAAEWMPIFGCVPAMDPTSPRAVEVLIARLNKMMIRAKWEMDEQIPSAALVLINTADLESESRKHINRPPPELGTKKR